MLFLIQFYKQVKITLKKHRPLLKFLSIKLIIFLFYLQTVSLIFPFISRSLTQHSSSSPILPDMVAPPVLPPMFRIPPSQSASPTPCFVSR